MYPIELQRLILSVAEVALVQYGEIDLAHQLQNIAAKDIPTTGGGTLADWVEGNGIGTGGGYRDGVPSTMPKKVKRDKFGNTIREGQG